LRAGARRTHGHARSSRNNVGNPCNSKRIAWRHQKPLFAACETDEDGIMKIAALRQRIYVGVITVGEGMQMDRRGDDGTVRKACEARLASLR